MKIAAVETLRPGQQPNVMLVRLHTDEGLTGIGESFYDALAVETYIHHTLTPALFDLEDPSPERVAAALTPYVGYQGSGVETRARGAVDLALWDLLGKRSELPVARLLGGPVRDNIRIYNTCAGPGYVSRTSRQETGNWGLEDATDNDDLNAFLTRPGELARELRDECISGMKIWPFDKAAERSGGRHIDAESLARGVGAVEAIRDAVGRDFDIMIELHGLWNRPAAAKICQALSRFDVTWVEDPLRPDAVHALGALAAEVDVQIAAGETLVGRSGFLPLLERAAIDVATCDPVWTGGLTEARKIATLADTFGVPVAPHDCTGPVAFAAACHLSLSQPNAVIQETVRAFRHTWYQEIATGVPVVSDGVVRITDAPGLGVELAPGVAESTEVRRTDAG